MERADRDEVPAAAASFFLSPDFGLLAYFRFRLACCLLHFLLPAHRSGTLFRPLPTTYSLSITFRFIIEFPLHTLGEAPKSLA